MKDEDKISVAALREWLNYDPLTGVFTWAKKPNRRIVIGRQAGSNTKGRPRISINGVDLFASRIAWAYVHGSFPSGLIDHINGNPCDNRISNLRDVSPMGNSQNMRTPGKLNTSGFLGVMAGRNGKWRAQIKIEKTPVDLGEYKTKEEAAAAYLGAKRAFHRTCTI